MKGEVRDWAFVERVAEPALALAPRDYLDNIRANVAANEIPDAVAEHDTPWIVNCLVGVSQYQGISDANAAAYTAKHGLVSSDEIESALNARPTCPLLQSYWHFHDCRYRKAKHTCAEPEDTRTNKGFMWGVVARVERWCSSTPGGTRRPGY